VSDTAPVEQTPEDEFIESFLDAVDRRFPTASSADPSPETDPAAPGDDQPPEGEEPPSPETAPEEPSTAEPPTEGEAPPEQGEAPAPGDGQPAAAFTLSGVDYSADQLAQMVPVYQYFANLTPQQVQGIDALMSGQYTLTPLQPPVAQSQPAAGAPPAPSPPTSSPQAEGEGDWLDPRAQREIAALRQQINDLSESFKANLTPVVQSQQQADYQNRLAAINRAHVDFQTKYGLDDAAMNALESSIAQGQILPGLAQRHGNLEAGMNAALEMMFWTTPAYRDRYEQQRITSQQAEHATEDAATLRKQQLTALSGSGGSAPRREPVPSTPEDRHAAMTQEIAAAMSSNGQIQ